MKRRRFFENFMLGVTQGEVFVEDSDLNIAAIHKLSSSATYNINIVSRSLSHQVFDRSDIIQVFHDFIHKSKNTSIRILLFDSTNVIKNSHRLVALADRIPSRITIRRLPRDCLVKNESFITADGKGYLHNPQSDRYEGSVSFNDKTRCGELDKAFLDYWHQSESDPELRRVAI